MTIRTRVAPVVIWVIKVRCTGFSKELFTRTDGQWKIGKERMKAMGVEAEVHNVSDII